MMEGKEGVKVGSVECEGGGVNERLMFVEA